MQPRSSSSTVQPLSRSRVLAMAAGARGLNPSYTLRASHGAQFGPLSWEKWESAEAREVGGSGSARRNGAEWAHPLLGRDGVACRCPSRVKRSCPGMVQLAS